MSADPERHAAALHRGGPAHAADAAAAPLLLQASNLGAVPNVVHAFTTRLGGVSPPPCDALNLGGTTPDDPANVRENRRRVAEVLGRRPDDWRLLRQVHGVRVVERTATDAADAPEADAQLTVAPHATLIVFSADCVPLLLAAPDGAAVGCAHAGWRGTVAGVAPAVARALATRAGCGASALTVAVGPGIGPCCFTVGEEVAAQLAAAVPPGCAVDEVVRRGPNGTTGDLWRLNVALLCAAGVRPEGIEVVRRCTRCDAQFFSHRRDHGRTGRQAAVIGRVLAGDVAAA